MIRVYMFTTDNFEEPKPRHSVELITEWHRRTLWFAIANGAVVRLGYNGSFRLVKPYAMDRTRNRHTIVRCLKYYGDDARSYRIDRIESIEITGDMFRKGDK